jgi:hypothetical protein
MVKGRGIDAAAFLGRAMEESDVTHVLNWAEELKARAAAGN